MDLSAVIESFAANYTVTRRTRSSYGDDGFAVAGSSTAISIRACIQPAQRRDLVRAPEGLRTEDALVAYTPTLLQIAGTSHEPDLISYNGDSFQVSAVERWSELGSYWKVLLTRVGAL